MAGVSWLSLGNLNNGVGNGGLSIVNANNGLGNARWNILARISENAEVLSDQDGISEPVRLSRRVKLRRSYYKKPRCGENWSNNGTVTTETCATGGRAKWTCRGASSTPESPCDFRK